MYRYSYLAKVNDKEGIRRKSFRVIKLPPNHHKMLFLISSIRDELSVIRTEFSGKRCMI